MSFERELGTAAHDPLFWFIVITGVILTGAIAILWLAQ